MTQSIVEARATATCLKLESTHTLQQMLGTYHIGESVGLPISSKILSHPGPEVWHLVEPDVCSFPSRDALSGLQIILLI